MVVVLGFDLLDETGSVLTLVLVGVDVFLDAAFFAYIQQMVRVYIRLVL